MPGKPLRVVIDTNLWISFLIKTDYSALTSLIISGEVVLIFSSELMGEFVEVTRRPKFKKYFSATNVADLIEIIDDYAEFVEVTTNITLCRDVKDNFLLSLAADGKADYMLTGDADLLELDPQGKTQIILIADFFKDFS